MGISIKEENCVVRTLSVDFKNYLPVSCAGGLSPFLAVPPRQSAKFCASGAPTGQQGQAGLSKGEKLISVRDTLDCCCREFQT